MDFFQIKERTNRNGTIEIYPDFKVIRSKDLMVRGRSFYAIWDEELGLWSTDEYDVARLVDCKLRERADELRKNGDRMVSVKSMNDFSTKSWAEFRNYINHVSDNAHQLDERLTFSDTVVRKEDYVSKRLAYPLKDGNYDSWDEIVGTLYDEDERAKIEWSIGAIISGDAKSIQKFIVFYGEAGAGKSTILNIIQQLFHGYYTTFEAKALTSSNNAFSTEVFKSNPLVAIQHDGDLSRIEDNTKLNSIVSHEEMTMNEKYKPSYTARTNCFLYMATNKPVKITDGKSGVIRRLIDIKPSGRKIPAKRYHQLMSRVQFELGAIASHCLDVYKTMGPNYYNAYRPIEMMYKTDTFFNFVEAQYDIFKDQDNVTLTQAYDMYKTYCDEALADFKLPRHKFREELKNYFREFYDITRLPDGKQVRSYYSGFLFEKFESIIPNTQKTSVDILEDSFGFNHSESILDIELSQCKAQYAVQKNNSSYPEKKWSDTTTTLSDLDTHLEHYVQMPKNMIFIDFDLKDDKGNKSKRLNLKEASKWPATYGEFSKGGEGVHLHYWYDGDVDRLSNLYSEGIEIKVQKGNSSLRRRLSKCNNVPIATINSGLPLKGEKKMLNFDSVKSEKGLRDLITRNLNKEIHPGTKPSVEFIKKILDDAYANGLSYDISDMRQKILLFAMKSTNHKDYCVSLIPQMKFKSEEISEPQDSKDDVITFFDIEVFPNLLLVNWKYQGDTSMVRMINPKPQEIEALMKHKLVGFNCRRYDNHILYARYLGYNNEELYKLSQKIVNSKKGQANNGLFGEAYNISYTDVYDFASAGNKKSLKKFEIELGIHHQELGLPWDEPVPEERWAEVAEYCDNDVIATEAVFNHLSADWTARQILAELSGLSCNDTTNMHTTKIIFGDVANPQKDFVYTDLSEMFPGYKFENGVSTYRGEETGEGGYVYAEPGIHHNVALLDVASMHPSSIENLNLFGPYTERFSEIKQVRIYIKHREFDKARQMMNGRLAPYLDDEKKASELANALKTVINSVYGLTSAKFDNKFRDPRNKDNIVAKRGALFMLDLKHAVKEMGYTVAHIKTDSIKIPNADEKIINFVMDFGKKYGYTFEHEATYSKMCLVNDAVYIAQYADGKHAGEWTATGAQFAHPYVFKTLFSKEKIEFEDMCETKSVSTALYLDLNEDLPENEHNYTFIGKVSSFVPILAGYGGGILYREKDGKYYSVTGTKGYRWLEAETVKLLDFDNRIDHSYYRQLVDDAIDNISKHGDADTFIGDLNVVHPCQVSDAPWLAPCGKDISCAACDKCQNTNNDFACDLGYDISEVIPF